MIDWATFTWHILDQLEAAREGWLQLQRRAVVTPFQDFTWVSDRVLAARPDDRRAVRIVVGERHGVTEVIVPLRVVRRWGATQVSWLAEEWCDYNLPLVSRDLFSRATPQDGKAFWAHIRTVLGRPDLCVLLRQPDRIAGEPNPFLGPGCHREGNLAYSLRLGGTWEAFAAARWSKATLQRLRQKENGLRRMGTLTFRQVDDLDERSAVVRTLLAWKSEQLERQGARNPFRDPATRLSLGQFAGKSEAEVEVYSLDLDGRPIAAVMALPGQTSLTIYQMAYKPGDLGRKSPGRILLHRIMAEMMDRGRTELDFAYGDDPYKIDICDTAMALSRSVSGHSWRGVAPAAMEIGRLVVKRSLKADRRMVQVIFAVRRRLANVLGLRREENGSVAAAALPRPVAARPLHPFRDDQ